MDGHVTLEMIGLGARRALDLGKVTIAPKSVVTLSWSPAASPIAPVGTSARIYAKVAFEREGVGVRAPAQILSLAFSEDGSKAFISATDDTGVRLASLGRISAGLRSQSLSAEDRVTLLGEFRDPRGRIDGAKAPPREIPNPNAMTAASETRWGDTLKFPGDLEDNLAASFDNDLDGIGPLDPPVFNPCGSLPISFQFTTRVCAEWTPEGFRDIGVSSSVPTEDYNLEGPAAYANASVYNGSTLLWQGRLDNYGCSPTLTYCMNRVEMRVSTASLQIPTTSFNGITLYGTRDFVITPKSTYIGDISFGTTARGTFGAISTIRNPDNEVRVASVVSRLLTMPDSGVLRHSSGSSAPDLRLHTENGCPSPEFQWFPGIYGEACVIGHHAWFGLSLGVGYYDPELNPVYVPTGRHTTEDAYTIGHELGHAMQRAANGGPGPGPANYKDRPAAGMCSCAHVSDGNQLHCLQSRHEHPSAELEGFGHFYAARVMNDQGSTCRFTYYKDYRKINAWSNPPQYSVVAPPVPVSCSGPFLGMRGGQITTGWVSTLCPLQNKSSEYDWLTFFWAVNGSASTSVKSSMTDLFAILGGAGDGANFTWTSLSNKATAHFGLGSSKLNRFLDSGRLHGVNL